METAKQETSKSDPANATEAPPTGSQATSVEPAKLGDDLATLTSRICSRPAPSEPSAEESERKELGRRTAAHQKILDGMGSLYQDCTAWNYLAETDKQKRLVTALKAYAQNMPAEVEAGNGIVLFGSSGTGKDHLLAALCRPAMIQHGLSVVWKNGMDLYGEMRDNIRNDKAEQDWVASLVKPDILYVSDPLPPSGDLSPFQAAMLQRILDGRIRDRKPCWVSMNVSGSKEADKRMGPALVDRLKPGAVCCLCNWDSHRKPRMV